MNESLGNNDALVEFIEDGSFFVVETRKEIFDVEKLESVEKYLTDNFLLPYWVGDEEKMPKLSNDKWANSLDDDEIDYEIKELVRKKKNPINNIKSTMGISTWVYMASISTAGTYTVRTV